MLKLTSSHEINLKPLVGTDTLPASTFIHSTPQKSRTGQGFFKNLPAFFSDREIGLYPLSWKFRRILALFFESITGILEEQDVNFRPVFFIRYGTQQRPGKPIP